jgi:hypothetical protein
MKNPNLSTQIILSDFYFFCCKELTKVIFSLVLHFWYNVIIYLLAYDYIIIYENHIMNINIHVGFIYIF